MVDVSSWLIDKFGPPPYQGPKKFHVEYIAGRQYIGTSMMASTVSEIIDKIIEDAGKNNTVGRMAFCPVVQNEICSFKLMNCERFS